MIPILGAAVFRLVYFVLHVNHSGSFPKPLTAAEERECLTRMQEGDAEAQDTLIEHNLRLVMHIIKKYYSNARDQEDLLSVGTIGLIKGVITFKPEKGTRLATYAARCIENAIHSLRKHFAYFFLLNKLIRTCSPSQVTVSTMPCSRFRFPEISSVSNVKVNADKRWSMN